MATNRRPRSVVEWLESLNLDQFRNEFLFNGYKELHHLCNLTEEDLNCIGITLRGYQKRILSHLPTEAEATLSEFSTGISTSDSIKPKIPPRRSKMTADLESCDNGHSTQFLISTPDEHTVIKQKPTFDDESYIRISPEDIKANMQKLQGDLPRGQTAPFNSGSTRSRTAVAPEVPQRDIPQIPPRRSQQESIGSFQQSTQKPRPLPRKGDSKSPPPPLPQRNEKIDTPNTKPIPKKRAIHTQSHPESSVFSDFDSTDNFHQRTNSTNPFRPFSEEPVEDYDDPQLLINTEPPNTVAPFNPFNPFNSVDPLTEAIFSDPLLDPNLSQRLQDRPVPQPPQTTTPEPTVTTKESQSPLVAQADLLRRPVPQPPGTCNSESLSNLVPETQVRSCPDGSPATSQINLSPLNDELEFTFVPSPPTPHTVEPTSRRSPPPPPPEELDEIFALHSRPAPLTVPPHLELFDPIKCEVLSERELPPSPPSQQDAEASLLKRLHSRPVPQPPMIPPRSSVPPIPPARSIPPLNQSEHRTDIVVPLPRKRGESDLIDMTTPQVEPESQFHFDSQSSSKEDSMEELRKLKLNQSFDDSQSSRSKDSPDSGLGFLHDNQSDHSHQSDLSHQSEHSHHSDHSYHSDRSMTKQDSVEFIPPPHLPPKSHSTQSTASHDNMPNNSSYSDQQTNMKSSVENQLSLETIVPFSNAEKNNESFEDSEYDFLRDSVSRPISNVYYSLSDAESRPLSAETRPLSADEEYLTLADAESRPISLFGHQPMPLPSNFSSHRPVPPVPSGSHDIDHQDSRASYLMLSDATSGGIYNSSTTITKSLPPVPTEGSDAGTLSSNNEEEEPIRPMRRAPPIPPERGDLTPSLPPTPKYAQVNKGFIEEYDLPVVLPPSFGTNNDDEYDMMNFEGGLPPHHGSFSSFRELAQSEDSESEAELLDDFLDDIDPEEERDSVHSLEKIPPVVPASSTSRNSLEERLKRISTSSITQQNYRQSRTHSHSRSIDADTRQRFSATVSKHQEPILKDGKVIEKSGYLWKQGGSQSNKGFRKRWVVFKDNEMRYYENEKKMNETKRIIPVGAMRDVQNMCGIPKFADTKPNRILLETIGRSFQFAAETCDDGTLWASILMKAILLYQPPPGGYPVGGDMSCPDKAGYLKMEGCSQKRYIAIKGEMMCYYNSKADFESAIPVGDIQMKLASVKDMGKNKINMFTPSKTFVLLADSQQDLKEWMSAMNGAIAEGLSDHTVIAKIHKNPDNRFCAECGMPDPDWASINFGVIVCKRCSGFHRELGVHMSKVRSLKMDVKVWTDDLIQMMLDLGNKRANAFWEFALDVDDKPVPDGDNNIRQLFLQKKYKAQLYADVLKGDQTTLDKKLLRAASANELEECMRLLYSGANLSYTGEDGKNAFGIAKAYGYYVLAEFLQQNSGYSKVGKQQDNGSSSPNVNQRKAEGHGKSFVRTTKDSKQEGIRKAGFLFKTGSNRRDFLRRYCVLEHGIMTYYVDEKVRKSSQHDALKASYSPQLLEQTSQQQNFIEGIEMVLVALTEPKAGHKYCFEIVTTYGRAYLFAAETEIERKEWMMALAKIHSLDSMWQSLQSFEFAGFLHKKDGAATTSWQRLWFILKGKSLMFYSVTNDSLDEIDLRKVVTFSRQEGSERSTTSEFNQYISVVLPGKIVYLRAETKQASDAWFGALQKAAAHKGPALDEQQLTGENVPIIVSECIKFIATHDGLNTEGIYRLSGTNSVIGKIVSQFAEDPRSVRLSPDEFTLHDVTGALKKYFRELPDPLMTQKLYKEWIDKAECQDHDRKLQWYHYLLGEMPALNYDILKVLIGHLRSVQANATENKMETRNLAAVFGPTLMASSDQSFSNTDKEIKVIADLITYYTWLFGVSEEQIIKEQEINEKYKDGLAKLKEAQLQARRSEADMDLLVEMYIGNKESGRSINIKLNKSQTADEILNQVVAQQELPGDNWALVEVICNGELERLFHGYERVLVEIMAWNPQIAAGNYICIKENPIQPHISLYIKSMHAWNGLLRYCEARRKFNKYHFDLSNNVLNYFKDNKSGTQAIGGWKVADLKIYMGLEKKKQPPSEWGISFTVANEHTIRAICFEKQEDLYMWLGGLLKSKMRWHWEHLYSDIENLQPKPVVGGCEQPPPMSPTAKFVSSIKSKLKHPMSKNKNT